MMNLNREQAFAVGGLGALLIICMFAIVWTLQLRAASLGELAERRDQLQSLEARMRSTTNPRRQLKNPGAPAQAFLDAPTSGLATARFQAYLSQLIVDQHAVLVSSGVPAADHDDKDKNDAIRLQIALNATLPALQGLLYRLESGTPYVLVEGLSMQPSSSGERTAANPVLRINLTLQAFWHHGII